jgi:integrase
MQKDEPTPLPKGLYPHRARFRTRDEVGKWITFEGPQDAAIDAYNAWRARNVPTELRTIGWLLDQFTLIECPQRVKQGKLKQRTADDYLADSALIKLGIGHFRIPRLQPKHVYEMADVISETQPHHVRNILAALSAAMTYAVRRGYCELNPCKQVQRPKAHRRTRLITHDEYIAVYDKAPPMVQLAMTLAVRTLAIPSDLVTFGASNVKQQRDRRVFEFRRQKTGAMITIALQGELLEVIDKALQDDWVQKGAPFLHTRERKGGRGTDPSRYPPSQYTIDGLRAMFQDARDKAKVTDFGLRDLRAKGATDMYLAGIPIRDIQTLLGHTTESTTRIYIKSYLGIVVEPNMVAIVAAANRG